MPADSNGYGKRATLFSFFLWFKGVKKMLEPWQRVAGPEAGGQGLPQRPRGVDGGGVPWVPLCRPEVTSATEQPALSITSQAHLSHTLTQRPSS